MEVKVFDIAELIVLPVSVRSVVIEVVSETVKLRVPMVPVCDTNREGTCRSSSLTIGANVPSENNVLSSVSFGSCSMMKMVIDGSRKKPSQLLNFVNYSSCREEMKIMRNRKKRQ